MQRHDGFLAFFGFQEAQQDLGIHETILGEDRRTVGVLQDVERLLDVWISVRVVRAKPIAIRQPELEN